MLEMGLCLVAVMGSGLSVPVPVNHWTRIDLQGNANIEHGLLAFSGMAVHNGQLFLFGGGHWDYWGNEVATFNIQTGNWANAYLPDPSPNTLFPENFDNKSFPCAVFYPANEPIEEARPLARHSYDSVEYMDSLGGFFVGGSYTYGDGSFPHYPWSCGDTWVYEQKLMRWNYLDPNQTLPVHMGEGVAAAVDPINGVYIQFNRGETHLYDPKLDSWLDISQNNGPQNSIASVATYASNAESIFVFGGSYPASNELWAFHNATQTWTLQPNNGSPPPPSGGYGILHLPVHNVLLVAGFGGLWAYDLGKQSWFALNPGGEIPFYPDDQIYGRFKYDPINQIALLVFSNAQTGYRPQVWAYRFAEPSPAIWDILPFWNDGKAHPCFARQIRVLELTLFINDPQCPNPRGI